ncbi:SigE family RNA polymerase sigma factor [Actinocorallia longicatena]|uniref:SigE family RNA polymerase sigma factor n=1 Tax=Actinocorallia longicatena TaxID=111803 RepID=A0ABP6QTB4_9ACTN
MDDAPAYEEFVATRLQALLRYGYVLAGSRHDAADLVQDALIRLSAAWPRVVNKSSPEGYVRTTMARLHISVWRRRQRETLVDEVPEGSYEDSSPADDALWRALGTLPRRQRAVLVLRYYEALGDAEIASLLGISRGTVRSQASRALEKLRLVWGEAVLEGRSS